MATLLQRFVDADQWEEAEGDIVARLGMFMHAAFLAAGFHPYGAEPGSGHLLKREGEEPGTRCLSRQYTAPQLARRAGADAAVLLLCAQGGDVALVAFLTTESDLRGVYRERLQVSSAAMPLLSRRLLRDTEHRGSRICWRLAGGVCWGLLAELCRRNDLPLTGLMSVPDDVKVEILKRLADGDDLARVECTCAQMRRLVAEREGELWKPMYEALAAKQRMSWCWGRWCHLIPLDLSDLSVSWKRKYVRARTRYDDGFRWSLWSLRSVSNSYSTLSVSDFLRVLDGWPDPPEEDETVSRLSTLRKGTGVDRRKVPRKEFKTKRHGSGAIHAPSSRYRWKHR